MPCRTSRPEIAVEKLELNARIAIIRLQRWPRCVGQYGTLKPRFGGAFLSAILGLGHCIALSRVRVAKPGSSLIPAIGPPLAEGRAVRAGVHG
jgi:hypothetical protein